MFVISSPGAENEGFINLLFVYCSHVMGCVAFENLGDLSGTCMAKVKPVKPIVCLIPLSNLRYCQMWSASIPFQLPSGQGDPGN